MVPVGCSKRMLNTIALISPFGTHQVALEPALPVPQGSPQHGLYPNENTTAEESRNVVPEGVGSETGRAYIASFLWRWRHLQSNSPLGTGTTRQFQTSFF